MKLPNFQDDIGPDSRMKPLERQHLRQQVFAINSRISRYLTLITITLTPLLLTIDIQRWNKGLFSENPFYWMLAGLHILLVLSTIPGVFLWLPKRWSSDRLELISGLHLVTLTSSLAGMGALGILERGGLVLVAIALLCVNLVYEIKFRQRLYFNLGLSAAGIICLILYMSGDLLKSLIAVTELLALVLICTISGEMRFRNFRRLTLAEYRLGQMAHFDALTGLANRRNLEEHLQRYLQDVSIGGVLSVISVDVDHFKSVNDTFGHDAGDAVLKAVASKLDAVSRQQDTVGRWGGEEFLVLCPQTPLAAGRLVAERMAQALRNHSIEKVGRKTASFGVAEARPGESMDALLVRADQAVYAAKAAGRDRVCVEFSHD
jgi:diguanylate cyclase (GGDEF)-like protein